MNKFTCKNLIAMGRHIPLPFYLDVKEEQQEFVLKIDSILRVVPGKRIVALSQWRNQTVVVKLFFRHGHWKQSMLQDLSGVNLLRKAGIPTPRIIGQANTLDQQGAMLFIEYLRKGESLQTLFNDAIELEDKAKIIGIGLESIARCHQAGLWQRDIHLGNFMLSDKKVYVLDGGDIKGDGSKLTVDTCLKNLGLFLAQFPVDMDKNVGQLLTYYQNNDSNLTIAIAEKIKPIIIAARLQRIARYKRKLFRSTTANRVVQTSNRFAVYDRSIHSSELEAAIRDPDKLMAKSIMLKDGNSSTVAMIQFDGRDFVLKRYNIKSFTHGLSRLLQPGRAYHSWRNASVLEMLGIATPHPYMIIEERLFWVFRRRAWYLSEFISSDNLLQQVEQQSANALPMEDIIEKFKLLFKSMQDYKISHGDMKASNFIYKSGKLYVLDLDAMRCFQSTANASRQLAKDMARFRKNWEGTEFEPLVQQLLGDTSPAEAV